MSFHFFGASKIAQASISTSERPSTNKIVGSVFFQRRAWKTAMGDSKLGCRAVRRGGLQSSTSASSRWLPNDFSNYIQAFKKTMSKLSQGPFHPPEWATFSQSGRRNGGSSPRSLGDHCQSAAVFRSAFLPALGPRAEGMSPRSVGFLPSVRSSLTGQSAAELCVVLMKPRPKRDWNPTRSGVDHAPVEAGFAALNGIRRSEFRRQAAWKAAAHA